VFIVLFNTISSLNLEFFINSSSVVSVSTDCNNDSTLNDFYEFILVYVSIYLA
jgi:hypothetical protein